MEIIRWGKVKAGGNTQVIVLYMLFPLLLENIIGTTTDQHVIHKVEKWKPQNPTELFPWQIALLFLKNHIHLNS